jgi:nucleotide-binding universal stress UspA family protein
MYETGGTVNTILCASDGSPGADEALRQASALGGPGARLIVLHIYTPPVPLAVAGYGIGQLPASDLDAIAAQARESIGAQVVRAGVGGPHVEIEVAFAGSATYAEIVRRAETVGADVVVVGGQGATGLARILLGSVAQQVVRHSHAPVLVARPSPRGGEILAATDLSEPARHAVRAASQEARRRKSRLVVAHFLDLPPEMMALGWSAVPAPSSMPESHAGRRRQAEEDLRRELETLGVEAEPVIGEGAPATSIVKLAEQRQASLIVVGTAGRTGLSRVLLGSVAAAVVERAHSSVLVVR